MKFRKKPVVIEAMTFAEMLEYATADPATHIVDGMPWSFKINGHAVSHENDKCYIISTLEGTHNMTPADMLIIGIKGEIYLCKIDIFEQTYEKVEEYKSFNKEEAEKGWEAIRTVIEKRLKEHPELKEDIETEFNKVIADRFALLNKRYLDRCGHIEIWDAEYIAKEIPVHILLEMVEHDLKYHTSGQPTLNQDWRYRVLKSRIEKEIIKNFNSEAREILKKENEREGTE